MPGVESFSSVGRSQSKRKRDREFEGVQLSQLVKEKILFEQRRPHEYLEKEAEQAFQGEFTAQKRLSSSCSSMRRLLVVS